MFCFKHDASHISKLMEKGDFTKVYEELLKFDPNVMNNSEVLPNVMKFYILKSKMCHHIFKGEGDAAKDSAVMLMDIMKMGLIPNKSEEERKEELKGLMEEVTGSVSDLTEVDSTMDKDVFIDPYVPERKFFSRAFVNYINIYCQNIFGCTTCHSVDSEVFQLHNE